MNEKLFKLIDYFRNYTFSNDYTQIHNPPNDLSLNTHMKKLQTQLEESIGNAKALMDLYEQKLHQNITQNETLVQQIEHLKTTMSQDKKQTDKLLDTSRQIIQELRKQLMQKDQENKVYQQKIQHLQTLQADELNYIKKQQNEEAWIYEKQLNEQKLKNEELMKQLKQQLQDQKQYNNELIDKINSITQQLQTLSQQNSKLRILFEQPKDYISKDEQVYSNYNENLSVQNKYKNCNDNDKNGVLTKNLQIYDSTQQEYNHIQDSQDQNFNNSYQQPTALKDVLNSSCDYNNSRSRYNMTRQYVCSKQRQYIGSKQKQNMQDNFIKINNTNSSKKYYNYHRNQQSHQKNKIYLSKGSTEEKFYIYGNGKDVGQFNIMHDNVISHGQNVTNDKRIINEQMLIQKNISDDVNKGINLGDMNGVDIYNVFFVLTAQCIKINSEYFELIAQVDIVDRQWQYVIQNRIPMNKWCNHLQKSMLQQVGLSLDKL